MLGSIEPTIPVGSPQSGQIRLDLVRRSYQHMIDVFRIQPHPEESNVRTNLQRKGSMEVSPPGTRAVLIEQPPAEYLPELRADRGVHLAWSPARIRFLREGTTCGKEIR